MNKTVLALISFWLTLAEPGFACTCTDNLPPRKALRSASAVFLGEVKAVDDSGLGDVVFEVLASWKEVSHDTDQISIFSAPIDGCGFRFEANRTYLVYALDGSGYLFDLPGELVTDACTRTAEAEDSKVDLGKLRRPQWCKSGAREFLPSAVMRRCLCETPPPVVEQALEIALLRRSTPDLLPLPGPRREPECAGRVSGVGAHLGSTA